MTAVIPIADNADVRCLQFAVASSTCSAGSVMDNPTQAPVPPDHVPLGQRLFDNVFLLLGAGLLIMLLLYTGWGLWEITSLPAGQLP